MPVIIKKRYDDQIKSSLTFNKNNPKSVSKTKQSFSKEANINNIMARYAKTGVLVDPATINAGRIPQYGDFTDGAEFLDMQNRIATAHQNFELLPSNIRSMFDNSPEKLLDFVSNEENLEACQELGLVDKPEPTIDEDARAAQIAAQTLHNNALNAMVEKYIADNPTPPQEPPTVPAE